VNDTDEGHAGVPMPAGSSPSNGLIGVGRIETAGATLTWPDAENEKTAGPDGRAVQRTRTVAKAALLRLGFRLGVDVGLPVLKRLRTGLDAFEIWIDAAGPPRTIGLLRRDFLSLRLLFLLTFLALALALALLLRRSRFVHPLIVRRSRAPVIMIRAIYRTRTTPQPAARAQRSRLFTTDAYSG